ncbi:MAG: outer membrane protein, partial [bacterium]
YLTCTPWTPYVGAGIGLSYLKADFGEVDVLGGSKSVYNLAWQVMAGVAYDINENWTVEAGYRLFNTSKVKMAEGNKVKMPFASSLELGLRYNF